MNHHRNHTYASDPALLGQQPIPYREAWAHYMIEGRPVDSVRPEILHFWRRFRLQKVDEGTAFKWTYRFPSQAYWRYMSTFATLHTDLKGFVEDTADESPLFLLCDEEGTVLDLYPSKHRLLLPPYGFQVMLHLLDEHAPPTALNLVLNQHRMNWMIGAEHPHPLFHTLTSFAWPIPAMNRTEKLYLVLLSKSFELNHLLQLGSAVAQRVLQHIQFLQSTPSWKEQKTAQWIKPPNAMAPSNQHADQPRIKRSMPSEFSEEIAHIVHELRNPLTALQGYLSWQKEQISAQHHSMSSEDRSQAPLIGTMLDELEAVSHLLDRLLWRYHQEAPRPRLLSFGKFVADWFSKHHETWPKRVMPRIMYALTDISHPQETRDLAIFDPKQMALALELITSLYDASKLLTPVIGVGQEHLHLLLKYSSWPGHDDLSHEQDWESARRIIIVNRGRIRRFKRFQLITLTLPRYTE
ncbi:MAG: histidine kinase dimerization/phospho-acceptor domain-containing protein [Candidatus Carbobacillus sp.]|nr:histidine kinase dimerization/phospho-acceptor domain-containing protein [Candidatus Carbobacillus sp.]